MTTDATPPAFYQERHTFIRQIADYGNETTDCELLINYLNFYKIKISEELAAKHSIWQSHIHRFRIIEQKWTAKRSNGCTLVVSHGYFDHTGIYGNVIRWGLSQGYDVHFFDAPGHGLSSGVAASIDSFDDYSEVLTHILNRENYANYSLFGQSTGSAIIANCLLDKKLFHLPSTPKHIFLLAPLIRSHLWLSTRWIYFLTRPGIKRIKRSFHASSHDQYFTDFLATTDPLQARYIPLNWLGAMEAWHQKTKYLPQNESVSPIIIQGTGDRTVDWHYNLPQLQKLFPAAKAFLIEGAAHQLVNENEEYWQRVTKHLSH